MTVPAEPEALLSHLPRADGSATYSYGGYSITASANGPIEAQRRDEDPNEALVDVVVRPAAGVGGKSFGVKPHLQIYRLTKNPPYLFPRLYRHQRTPSRVPPAVLTAANHPREEFPTLSCSGRSPDQDHAGE